MEIMNNNSDKIPSQKVPQSFLHRNIVAIRVYSLLFLLALISLNCGKEIKPSFEKGMNHFNHKEYDQAINEFTLLLKSEPNNAEALYWRAVTNIALKKFERGLTDLNKAIKIKADYGKALYARGAIKYVLKDFEGAFFDFKNFIHGLTIL